MSVSFYLKDFTLMRSAVVITGPLSKGFYSLGNRALSSVLPVESTRSTNTYYFLTGLDVLTGDDKRCVVCYGDSITSQSWPDYLAMKCMDDPFGQAQVRKRNFFCKRGRYGNYTAGYKRYNPSRRHGRKSVQTDVRPSRVKRVGGGN